MSLFDAYALLPPDPIFGLNAAFKNDPRPEKINLGIGTYQDAAGRPYVLQAVRAAEAKLATANHEYGPIEGDAEFRRLTAELIFRRPLEERVAVLQTIGATGGLRVGATLLKERTGVVHISRPTWPNHRQVFEAAGFAVKEYDYYDAAGKRFDCGRMLAAIAAMGKGEIILLQGPCHNPTGCDPTVDEWQAIADAVKQQGLIPFFDVAYLGFAKSVDADGASMRLFVEAGHECLISFSYAKNMGLYGERAGALIVVTKGSAEPVMSWLKKIARSSYSNPPIYGTRLVATILGDAALKKMWLDELDNMRTRIGDMRVALAAGLMAKVAGVDASFIERGHGLFCLLGLQEESVRRLKEEYALYMPGGGRINVAGLLPSNMDRVVDALKGVLS